MLRRLLLLLLVSEAPTNYSPLSLPLTHKKPQGFCVNLLQLSLDVSRPEAARQLAAVLVKRYTSSIKRYTSSSTLVICSFPHKGMVWNGMIYSAI